METSWNNMQQLPKAQCAFLSDMEKLTIQNNLDPVYTGFKIIASNSE